MIRCSGKATFILEKIMRQMLALLSSALFLFSAQLGAVVLTLDAKSVTIADFGETGLGLMSGKSPEPLIQFTKADRFYVQSALASALSLDVCIKVDTTEHALYVGTDSQTIENGWLIDARFVRKEGNGFIFRKTKREIPLDGLDVSVGQNIGRSGFFVVTKSQEGVVNKFSGFEGFVLSAADLAVGGKPTLRVKANEAAGFREVGRDFNWQTLRKGSRLGSLEALPTLTFHAPAARLRQITQSAVPTGDKFPSWRFQTGAILLSYTDAAHDLEGALARLKRNDDGQNQVVLVSLQLNGKWALLKVVKDSQTLFVDWSGQSTLEHLALILPNKDARAVRQVITLRPPKRGEDDSDPMFEKLEELLKEQLSPRVLISPRTAVEVLQHAAAVSFGVAEEK